MHPRCPACKNADTAHPTATQWAYDQQAPCGTSFTSCHMPMHIPPQQQTSGCTTAAQQRPPHPASRPAQLPAHHTAHLLWQLPHQCPPALPGSGQKRASWESPQQCKTALKTPLLKQSGLGSQHVSDICFTYAKFPPLGTLAGRSRQTCLLTSPRPGMLSRVAPSLFPVASFTSGTGFSPAQLGCMVRAVGWLATCAGTLQH